MASKMCHHFNSLYIFFILERLERNNAKSKKLKLDILVIWRLKSAQWIDYINALNSDRCD